LSDPSLLVVKVNWACTTAGSMAAHNRPARIKFRVVFMESSFAFSKVMGNEWTATPNLPATSTFKPGRTAPRVSPQLFSHQFNPLACKRQRAANGLPARGQLNSRNLCHW
jgi:hypothetical protein